MTAAVDVFGPKLPAPLVKANWLGRYLSIEKQFDKRLYEILKIAERSIARKLAEMEEVKISEQIRATQLRLARKTVRDYVNDLFGPQFGKMVRGYQADAAEAAINAALYDQGQLLARIFKNSIDRQNYADSLRQTARRNVESTITRILFTEMPLSQRVYKTKALANGMVSNVINNGLARGDSAADIARSVRSLISPDTPGGVSYAAKRLGRTEINNAFHAQAILDTQDKPWVNQMRWNLSKRHKSDPGDLCESYALTEVFDKELVPAKPHPQCRCFVTPVPIPYDDFENALVAGQYDPYLEDVMGGTYRSTTALGETLKIPGVNIREQAFETEEQRQIRQFGRALNDISTAPTPESVAYALKLRHPNLTLIGWTPENTTLNAARNYAIGIDEMMTKYPNNYLDMVIIGTAKRDFEYAKTSISPITNHSYIRFNRRFALDEELIRTSMAKDVASFYHFPGSEKNPYYSNAVHEFGHVLDGSIGMAASGHAEDILRREFLGKSGEIPLNLMDDFKKWLHKNIDGYGWDQGTGWLGLNSMETVAEAFADYEINGIKALKASQPLYLLLMFLTKHA